MTCAAEFDKPSVAIRGTASVRDPIPLRAPSHASDRLLGTMIPYGYRAIDLDDELKLARSLGVLLLEILPGWSGLPDPLSLADRVQKAGLKVHSAHGCWGGQSIRAARVDLGSTDSRTHQESIDDLMRCVDWLQAAGGKCLVVHPGGLSDENEQARRRSALGRGLVLLGEHARGAGVLICVENMPPGVYPGSRMADLAELLRELEHSQLALALDTGHANLGEGIVNETAVAGSLLATTHVHDNNGWQDTHLPPGHGTVDWSEWGSALDSIGYHGPIVLECIKHIRENPSSYRPDVLAGLARGEKAR
jgi:sugar phosphate isomerase/epimerase